MKTKSLVIQSLLALTLFMPFVQGATDSQSKKTFLSARPSGVNLPLEYTTWHDHVYHKKNPSQHTCLQVAGFFQGSTKGEGLGRYFGIGNGTNKFQIGSQGDAGVELDKLHFLHDDTGLLNNFAGKVSLNPKTESFGVLLQIFQDFDLPFGSIFISASLPFTHVSRDLHLNQTSITKFRDLSPADFFAGVTPADHSTRPAANLQGPLTHAIIDGRRSATGLADADLHVGFRVVDKDEYHAFLNIGLTIPAGNRVRGIYLFEPIYGNGGHCALGAGIDAGVNIWKNDLAKVRALFAADYRYLFEATESRTVGVKDKPLNHYFLVARDLQINKPLVPAANVLTQPLHVKPGSQLEVMTAITFLSSNFVVDAGYDLFWKDQESIWVKRWKDNQYYIVNTFIPAIPDEAEAVPGYDTSLPFDRSDAARGLGSTVINKENLDIDATKTPSLFTHKLFAGLGYTFYITRKCPVSLGIGASYEFAVTNADVEQWSAWVKLAGSF